MKQMKSIPFIAKDKIFCFSKQKTDFLDKQGFLPQKKILFHQ